MGREFSSEVIFFYTCLYGYFLNLIDAEIRSLLKQNCLRSEINLIKMSSN